MVLDAAKRLGDGSDSTTTFSETSPSTADGAIRSVVIASPGGITGGGGTGSVSREIQDWLVENDGNVQVVVIDTRGSGSVLASPLFFLVALVRLAILRVSRPGSVLHVQVTERGSFLRKGVVLRLGRLLKMRCVLHHHGAELKAYVAKARGWERAWLLDTVRKAHLNIVLGWDMQKFLIEALGVDHHRTAVLHNAVKDFQGPARPRTPSVGGFHFLLLANLCPRKGVSEFLQALARLRAESTPFRATIAGGGQVARYVDEATALGIRQDCTFTGWVKRDRVERLLGEADALVMPSYDEGLPMVILEALSARGPVIATPVGSIPEVLTDTVDCLFVKVGDVGALHAAMTRIIDEGDLREYLAEEGRKLFERKFQMRSYIENLFALYRRL